MINTYQQNPHLYLSATVRYVDFMIRFCEMFKMCLFFATIVVSTQSGRRRVCCNACTSFSRTLVCWKRCCGTYVTVSRRVFAGVWLILQCNSTLHWQCPLLCPSLHHCSRLPNNWHASLTHNSRLATLPRHKRKHKHYKTAMLMLKLRPVVLIWIVLYNYLHIQFVLVYNIFLKAFFEKINSFFF